MQNQLFLFLKKFKVIIIFILVILKHGICFPQKQIVIIGVTHTSISKFNSDSLYNTISQFEPTAIYTERNKSEKLSIKMQLGLLFGFAHYNLERSTILKYIKHNKNVCEFPFDIKFQNRSRYKLKKNKAEFEGWETINQMLNNREFSVIDSTSIKKYLDKSQFVQRQIFDSTLYNFNQIPISDSIELCINILYSDIISIIERYPKLDHFHKFLKTESTFWHFRNTEIAKNIIQEIQTSKNKKILIVTGLFHVYFIRKALLNHKFDSNVELINVNQYNRYKQP